MKEDKMNKDIGEVELINSLEFKNGLNSFYKFRTSCGCEDKKHAMTIEIEYDTDFHELMLTFYQNICWCDYWKPNSFFTRLWRKITTTWKLWFTGYIELEEAFIFRSEEQVEAVGNAILDSAKKIKELKNE